jgi:ubiquinone/menaquinone biosynthesis C-methylase UbiE
MSTPLLTDRTRVEEAISPTALREIEQREWYASYYSKAGTDRNDLRGNSEVLFQVLANERSFIQAFRKIAIEPKTLTVLDVGCGSGASWYQLFRLGVAPANASGIDLQGDRVGKLKDLYPQARTIQGDACAIPFGDGTFDLVYESTIFATLSDDDVRKGVASEMVRVCRDNGYLLLIDWRVGKFWDKRSHALNKKELKRLFGVGESCAFIAVADGALIPPVGRMISRYASQLYFLIARIFPMLVGQVAYLLQKQPRSGVQQ